VEAQLVWDEGMAASAAAYLKANPDRPIVILAGSGHVAFGSGIPSRLKRRIDVTYATVLSSGEEIEPKRADYILLSKKNELPPAGVLGVSLKEEGEECRIRSLELAGAAEKAGIKQGDVLVTVDGQAVKTIADVRLALWDKKPGDRVRVSVRRRHRLGTAGERNYEVELSAPGTQGAKA
jgi:S1-C subfamily serine protease